MYTGGTIFLHEFDFAQMQEMRQRLYMVVRSSRFTHVEF
jgi:hypothetical protein